MLWFSVVTLICLTLCGISGNPNPMPVNESPELVGLENLGENVGEEAFARKRREIDSGKEVKVEEAVEGSKSDLEDEARIARVAGVRPPKPRPTPKPSGSGRRRREIDSDKKEVKAEEAVQGSGSELGDETRIARVAGVRPPRPKPTPRPSGSGRRRK